MTHLDNSQDTPYHGITKPAFEQDPWDHEYYDFVDDVDSNLKLSGTLANRPASSNAPDEAWYYATDENLIYENDPTDGWTVIGHGNSDNPVPEGHYESVKAEEQANIQYVAADKGADTVQQRYDEAVERQQTPGQ